MTGAALNLHDRLAMIHRSVPCAHQERELLIIAETIVRSNIHGPVVELGCYKGGSTAKLSVACHMSGRILYVCDTFTGLPDPGQEATHHSYSGRVKTYSRGDYAGSLEEVKSNVEKFGEPDVCRYVPGLFSDTLPTIDVKPAVVFMDVDLVASARECLRNLWPHLGDGTWFTHEAGVSTFLRGLLAPRWWHDVLGQCPPVLIGAGVGFGPDAANLAYFEKGDP